jgi:hypothetical protein
VAEAWIVIGALLLAIWAGWTLVLTWRRRR